MNYVPTYTVTLTDGERIALKIALGRSLTEYRDNPPHYNVDTAPADSTIGMQRDLLAGLDAIGLGNRRGSRKFDIVMVRAEGSLPSQPTGWLGWGAANKARMAIIGTDDEVHTGPGC